MDRTLHEHPFNNDPTLADVGARQINPISSVLPQVRNVRVLPRGTNGPGGTTESPEADQRTSPVPMLHQPLVSSSVSQPEEEQDDRPTHRQPSTVLDIGARPLGIEPGLPSPTGPERESPPVTRQPAPATMYGAMAPSDQLQPGGWNVGSPGDSPPAQPSMVRFAPSSPGGENRILNRSRSFSGPQPTPSRSRTRSQGSQIVPQNLVISPLQPGVQHQARFNDHLPRQSDSVGAHLNNREGPETINA